MTLEKLLPKLDSMQKREIPGGYRVLGIIMRGTPIPPGVFVTRSGSTASQGYMQDAPLPTWTAEMEYRMTKDEYLSGYPSNFWVVMDLVEQENEFGTISP